MTLHRGTPRRRRRRHDLCRAGRSSEGSQPALGQGRQPRPRATGRRQPARAPGPSRRGQPRSQRSLVAAHRGVHLAEGGLTQSQVGQRSRRSTGRRGRWLIEQRPVHPVGPASTPVGPDRAANRARFPTASTTAASPARSGCTDGRGSERCPSCSCRPPTAPRCERTADGRRSHTSRSGSRHGRAPTDGAGCTLVSFPAAGCGQGSTTRHDPTVRPRCVAPGDRPRRSTVSFSRY